MSKRRTRAALAEALRDTTMVRVHRRSRPGEGVDGFVVALGREWVLLQRIVDGGYFNGHAAVRVSDVSRVAPDTGVASRFARTRPEWPPGVPSGWYPQLDDTAGMLRSLVEPGVLFGIERDRTYSGLWIGVPNELMKRWLYMWEFRPDATWHDVPLGYRLTQIVLVERGTRYHQALASIAGPPPAGASDDWSV